MCPSVRQEGKVIPRGLRAVPSSRRRTGHPCDQLLDQRDSDVLIRFTGRSHDSNQRNAADGDQPQDFFIFMGVNPIFVHRNKLYSQG